MKNFVKWLGIISMALVIGFSFAACDDGTTGGGSGGGGGGGRGGTFTITDIPSKYNGLYMSINGNPDPITGTVSLYGPGCNGLPDFKGTPLYDNPMPRISNGKLSTVLYTPDMKKYGEYKKYDGNDTFNIPIFIHDSAHKTGSSAGEFIKFNHVTFSNGSATVSWNDNR
jgi:hypothetical protein